jgi:hypothetical protein
LHNLIKLRNWREPLPLMNWAQNTASPNLLIIRRGIHISAAIQHTPGLLLPTAVLSYHLGAFITLLMALAILAVQNLTMNGALMTK